MMQPSHHQLQTITACCDSLDLPYDEREEIMWCADERERCDQIIRELRSRLARMLLEDRFRARRVW